MHARAKIEAKTPEAMNENSFTSARKSYFSQLINSPNDHILHLQKAIGNQAVQRLFESGVIQAKLKIGPPGDIYEQEAQSVSEQVMRMPTPPSEQMGHGVGEPVQNQSKTDGAIPLIQARTTPQAQTLTVSPQVSDDINSMQGGGQLLPAATRQFFENRTGQDFNDVRIHTDKTAQNFAEMINAKAFTLGNNIFFSTGQYAP